MTRRRVKSLERRLADLRGDGDGMDCRHCGRSLQVIPVLRELEDGALVHDNTGEPYVPGPPHCPRCPDRDLIQMIVIAYPTGCKTEDAEPPSR